MSQPKPADVTAATDWNKIRSWAAGQKIPTTAVNNVYALDQTRLQSGYYPMSNAERTRAILAAAGMDYSSALPTDNPGPSDIWGNTIRNIQGIATGLMPTRLASNIWDTLKTSVEDITHPGAYEKNGGLAGALTGSALSWLPGAYDIGTVLKAGGLEKGIDSLLEQPITSVLDVMPALKYLDAGAGTVAADTVTGQALADRLNITPKALGQQGMVRIMGKAIGQIPVSSRGLLWDAEGKPMLDADGKQIIGQKTLGQRARESALAHGTGHAISVAAEKLSNIGNTYTLKYRAIVKDLQTAVAKLTPDTIDRATGAITKKGTLSIFNEAMHSGRTADDLMNDSSLPLDVKKAIEAYRPWEEWHKEYMLNSGQLLPVAHVDGTVSLYERTTAEKLIRLSHLADQALDQANAASAAVDEINGKASQLEQAYAPLKAEMLNLRNNYLTKLALTPGKSAVYMGVVQRLSGLMDEMDKAFKAKDWIAFREAAKKADKTLASKQITGAPEKVRLMKVAGHRVVVAQKVENAFKAIRKDHVRLFKAESSGIDDEEGWTPSFEAAQREANGGIVYKVDIPRTKLWWMKDDGGDVGGKMSDTDLQQIMAKQKEGLNPEPRAVSLKPPEKGVAVKAIEGWDKDPNLVRLKELIHQSYLYGKVRADLTERYKKAWEGTSETSRAKSAQRMSANAAKAVNDFMKASRREVPAEYRDVVLQKFFQNFKDSDKKALMMAKGTEFLKSKGIDEDRIERMVRSDPRRMYELVAALAGPMFEDPFLPMMDKEDHVAFMNDALKEVESLRARGEVPMYVPTTGARFATSPYLADDRIYVNPVKYPTISASFKKAMDLSSTVNDVMLGVSKATKEALGKDATLSFWEDSLKPMLRAGSELKAAVARENQALLEHDISATAVGVTDALIEHEYGMVPFKVTELIDLQPEDVGLDPRETYYLPKAMKDQMEGLVGKTQFPMHGVWDKSTKVFKYAILGLSPRYTAHILFGGTMLLALRIDPGSFALIGDASKMLKDYHAGKLDEKTASVFQGSTQYGTPDQNFHFSGGRSMGNLAMQEWLDTKLGQAGAHKVATAAQWAEAAANINFRFTNYISDMQRAIAYLDGIRHAGRKGWINDPITGERVELTADKAHWLGVQSAERVMGNLQSMTPLERSVARKIMPFYGWTKHILKYVLTYPVDHPWRTSFLSVLSTQNTDSFSSGLDERMQLLFFLGSPDSSGNVTAFDIRQIDPFRDVANYATLSGWISSLNPILTAPIAAIDPSIIYGSNTLNPQVDYSSLYGTNVAQPSGGFLTAIEQEIPEVGALDSALGWSAEARAIKKEGGSAALKNTLSALGFPWTPQKLNLQQISAKHEIDRYNQAKTDALNAWQSGDFSLLLTYPGTVPDPLQDGYNITPLALYRQYQRAQKAFPGLPPSETIASLPAPAL